MVSAVTTTNCTVSGNTASLSGGGGSPAAVQGVGHTSTTTLYNLILAGNAVRQQGVSIWEHCLRRL